VSEWRKIPLSEIADIIGGYAFKSGDFSTTGFPVVKIANIEPPRVNLVNGERIPSDKVAGLDKFQLNDRDIVMAMTGATIGKVGRIRSSESSYLNQRVAKLSAKAGREFDDFIYALVSQAGFDEEVLTNSNGSAQANISTDGIGRILVPDFTLAEQLQIGRVIGSLDDKIELNRRMNETLEALAQSLFKSWFVDATLSALPKGWREVSVADEVQLVKGVSYRSEELADSNTALVTLKSMKRGGGYRTDGLKPYTGEFKPEQVITPGELVVAHTDVTQAAEVIGKPALVLPDERIKTLVASLDLSIVRPKVGDLSQHFFYLLFLTADFQAHVYGHTNGTTVLHLAKSGVPSYRFARPPENIARAFTEIVRPLFDRISANEVESRTLAALRDALLPKLLSGELRVPAAAKLMEACA
jgi:type I restriction enzyme S subunit